MADLTILDPLSLKGVYFTIWTIDICPLTILHKALLNIIGGKGGISNIKYYYYYYYYLSLMPLVSNRLYDQSWFILKYLFICFTETIQDKVCKILQKKNIHAMP